MKTRFDLNPDFAITIESHKIDNCVYIQSYEGVNYEKMPHEILPTTTWIFPKSRARAIASAIMGCAAEL